MRADSPGLHRGQGRYLPVLSAQHGAGCFPYIQVCPPNANIAMSRSQRCLQRAARTHGGKKPSAWGWGVRGQGQERKVAGVPRGFLNEAAVSAPLCMALEWQWSGVCFLIQQYGTTGEWESMPQEDICVTGRFHAAFPMSLSVGYSFERLICCFQKSGPRRSLQCLQTPTLSTRLSQTHFPECTSKA